MAGSFTGFARRVELWKTGLPGLLRAWFCRPAFFFPGVSSSTQHNSTNYYSCAVPLEPCRVALVVPRLHGFLLLTKVLWDMEAHDLLQFWQSVLTKFKMSFFSGYWNGGGRIGFYDYLCNNQVVVWFIGKSWNGHIACRHPNAPWLNGWFGRSWGQWAVFFQESIS